MVTKAKIVDGIKTVRGYPVETFKMAIGSPTNQERTYLVGDGVFVGDKRQMLVHALPIYKQKDYPNYQVRKRGPYVVSIASSGLRLSATAEKIVFAEMADAVGFAEAVTGLLSMWGLSTMETDPRPQLEKAKAIKESVYEAFKALATQFNATMVTPST